MSTVDFDYMSWQVMLSRLILASALGALVGQERERRDLPAGLRTHLLVSAGACLFTLVSIAVAGDTYDPGRIAAQIITGIGFLGAGTIIRHGASVRGLTTAASIWAVAGVGMAAGIGWWEAGVAATFLLYVSLTFLKVAERRLFRETMAISLEVRMDRRQLSLAKLLEEFGAIGCETVVRQVSSSDDGSSTVAIIDIENARPGRTPQIIDHISALPGVRLVRQT